jgi:hypothetical protein
MNTRKRKREEEETIRKKKVGGLTNTEKNEKKAEEQRLSQEISHFWPEFIDKTKCDMEKEIATAKKQKNTESTHKTLNTYVQNFKYFICSTTDDVCCSNPGKAAECFLLSTQQVNNYSASTLRRIKSGILSYLDSKNIMLSDCQKKSLQELMEGLSNSKKREDVSLRKELDQTHPISFDMVKHFFKHFPDKTIYHRRIRAIVAMTTVSMIRSERMSQMLNDIKDIYMYSDKELVKNKFHLKEGNFLFFK